MMMLYSRSAQDGLTGMNSLHFLPTNHKFQLKLYTLAYNLVFISCTIISLTKIKTNVIDKSGVALNADH